jgi:hypothetical protein
MGKLLFRRPSYLTKVRRAFTLAAVAAINLLSLGVAFGVEARPHTARVTAPGLAELLSRHALTDLEPQPAFQKVSTISLRGRVHGLGRFDVALTTKRNLLSKQSMLGADAPSGGQKVPILLQGSIALGGGLRRVGSTRVVPVAAALIDDQLSISFSVPRRSQKKREYVYLIRIPVTEGNTITARVKRLAQAAFERAACRSLVEGTEQNRGDALGTSDRNDGPTQFKINAVTRIITLSTDADKEWYSRYGNQGLAQIASIINTAEALYYQPFGFGFSIHKQHIYAGDSPYTATDAGALLSQFVRNPENRTNLATSPEFYESMVDAKHLFTGKDLDGSTAGIAYIRSICNYPALAFGLSQATFDVVAPAVFAHEVAHNLGAFHDMSSPGSLMYPMLTAGVTMRFSDVSLSQIEGYLAQSSGCLHYEDRGTSPTPTPGDLPGQPEPDDPADDGSSGNQQGVLSLEIRTRQPQSQRRLVVVRGRLRDGTGSGVGQRPIELHRNQKLALTKSTDYKGRVAFVIPRRHTRAVFLMTQGGQAVSRTIGFGREVR